MFPTKILNSVLKLLHSKISSKEIALGFSLGSIFGIIPQFNLIHFTLIIFLIILKANISAFIISSFLFKLVGYFLDPLAHVIGYYLLTKVNFLFNIWKYLYNAPIIPFTRFYNTVVLGSFIISIIFFIPVFVIIDKFVFFYRKNLADKVEKLKIIKILKLSKIYNWYIKFKIL